MSSLKSRVLVSVVCIPLLLWVVLWAPIWVLRAALAILSMIAAGELLMCVGLTRREKPANVLSVLTVFAALGTVVLGPGVWPILWAVYVVLWQCAVAWVAALLVRLILRDGLGGASVAKIARDAGVSPATIYVYYESKEAMVAEVFQECSRDSFDYLQRMLRPGMDGGQLSDGRDPICF